ncbi:MAG TPA: response regulator [Polyangiaceae bacterium]|nr:response regulator [Polyangiaceae bacterium]
MTEQHSPMQRLILLADDSLAIQRMVRRVVEKHGHKLIEVTEGQGVLAAAILSRPDIIVLDIEFPDADGRDVLARLKAEPRTASIPVVVWSGRAGHESDSRISLELGAEDYVEKNDAQILLRKLERVMLRFSA